MKATRDESTFTLAGAYWSCTYPMDELPNWLNFYRTQRDLYPKAGNSYDETIAELERLAVAAGGKVAQAYPGGA